MNKRISVIIPNHNGAATIGCCLDAAFASAHDNFEVIVVDDCSTDNSVGIINKFPCKFIQLDRHSGASKARNDGARNSSGEILFFTDADCVLQKNTLSVVDKSFPDNGKIMLGGSYTKIPFDDNFFSTFQSLFIHYSETKKESPDYVATHAMAISRDVFNKSGGFPEVFLPIIEDVEFSHRLRRSGIKLATNPDLLVQHIFNFTLSKSIRNAFRKSKYWTIYSLKNRDIFADSGTASSELKINVASYCFCILFLVLYFTFGHAGFLFLLSLVFAFNLFANRNFLSLFFKTKGLLFSMAATGYYMILYPLSVGAGTLSGIINYLFVYRNRGFN